MRIAEDKTLVAVHHTRFGTGFKRTDSYLIRWIRRQRAKGNPRFAKRLPLKVADVTRGSPKVPLEDTHSSRETRNAS